MKKTSIYLDPSLDEALAKRAADEGLSKAEFIRRSLTSVVGRPKRPKLSSGVYSGSGESAANNVDRWLAETGFGEE
ncbi:MAG: CopG family transcriptional regulator [Acidimicrobiales bacterium]